MVGSVASAAIRAAAGTVYYLAGVLVKPATKELAQRLIDKGFRIATKGMKDSKVPIHKVTDSNIVTYITRAIKAAKELRAPPRLDPKTGRPISNNKKGSGGSLMTTAGGRGQSALGRRIALSKMKNYGKVGPKSTSIPKKPPKKPIETPVEPTIQLPKSAITPVAKRIVQGLNIAAAGGIAKVAYDAFKDDEIKKLDLEVYRKNSGVLNANVKKAIDKVLEADRIEALKDPRLKKAGNDIRGLSGRPTYKKRTPKQEAQIANTPARRKAIERAVREALAFKIPNKNKGK